MGLSFAAALIGSLVKKPTKASPSGICVLGPNSEIPFTLDAINSSHKKHELRPCLETLTPVPRASRQGRNYGNVLCDVYMPDGSPDLASPRQLLRAQVNALQQRHGLLVKAAFEYEFSVFKEGTLEPVGNNHMQYADMRVWNKHQDIFNDLRETMQATEVELTSLMPEVGAGQWEVTTEPQEGMRGGDVAFHVKNVVKEFFPARGYQATFMSKVTPDSIPSALHLNHSLWVPGQRGEDASSAMFDPTAVDKLSETARHWIAGVLEHAPAISALCSPTLNCYRRLHSQFTPSLITWGVDNRYTTVRARNAHDNVFLENRLVSGAANPYLALAATVAAGMDGLDRRLKCPPPMDKSQAGELPRNLEKALEKDEELRALLGDRFVKCYVTAKREYEVVAFHKAAPATEDEVFEFDRRLYMNGL
ncbi:hypothetical protein BaRGS_00036485 [Batillaria attramentaria]|uniref:Lengsin n=1 Tax=Batillaria attramentaria TaxID=370345 RepID=A0ABD0JC89_9CAEN